MKRKETYLSRDFRETAAQYFPSQAKELNAFFDARIQSFPDWFEFKGKYTSGGSRRKQEVPRYTQVGNAVPPLFAEQIGIAIWEVLSNDKSE